MRSTKLILFCFGTRPEWLKIKPLLKVLNKTDYKLLFTGQHMDLLKDVEVDYKIQIRENDNRLDAIVAECMLQFPDGEFDSVFIQGDTGSAFGCALAAFHRGLRIYYLEAGLRSNDLQHPYPEEAYRQMISRISDANFCPTKGSFFNLINEKVKGYSVIVGNTVIDNLLPYKDECEYTDKILVTLHRRENHANMDKWFMEIEKLAKRWMSHYMFILPLHPNPNVQKHKHLLKHVFVVDPLPYDELLKLLVKARLVISDSGGIQEEAAFFNKKVIVCRKTTERPEGIETGHLFLCESPDKLKDIFEEVNRNPYIDAECPYGDGHTAEYIKDLMDNMI